MKKRRSSAPRRGAKQQCAEDVVAGQASRSIVAVAEDGGWAPAEQLKDRALEAASTSDHVALDFAGIDHLEASGLQVILACNAACKSSGKSLELLNVSSGLRVWFDHCGATDHFFSESAVNQ